MNGRVAKKVRKEAHKMAGENIELVLKAIRHQANLTTSAEEFVKDGNEFFNADEASGGNFDDAYELGIGDGQVEFARALAKMLGEGEEDGELS